MKYFQPNTQLTDAMNALREEASLRYQELVPVMDNTNAYSVLDMLSKTDALLNEFADTVINKIGLTVLQNRRYTNVMRPLHKGMLRLGRTIEEVFVNIAEVKNYNANDAETLYKRVIPDIRACYHIEADQKYTAQSVNRSTLRQAILSIEDLDRFVAGIMDSMHNAMEKYDEDKIKELISTAIDKQEVGVCVTEPVVDKETADKAVVAIKEFADNFTFLTDEYNYAGVTTCCPKENQVLILNTRMKNIIDVMQLAGFYNLSFGEFSATTNLVWRDFGRATGKGVWGILCDKEWFQIWDMLFEMPEPLRNPQNLDIKYYLHKWTNYGLSPFSNVVVFTDKMPVISNYKITPTETTIGKGDSVKFTVTVEGEGVLTADSTFEITGNKSQNTYINDNGYMVVGADETATTITFKATSTVDSSKTASATVTVTVSG